MTFQDVLQIIDYYETRVGWSVRDQARDVTEGTDPAGKNPNAMRIAREWVAWLERAGHIKADEAEELEELMTP